MRIGIGFEREKYENGKTLLEIYVINHFGSELIPPRPLLTMAIDQIVKQEVRRIEAFVKNLANSRPADRERIKANFLHTLGKMVVKRAKDIIDAASELQPNAPRTVQKKGFDQPLYETGKMRDGIRYEVQL